MAIPEFRVIFEMIRQGDLSYVQGGARCVSRYEGSAEYEDEGPNDPRRPNDYDDRAPESEPSLLSLLYEALVDNPEWRNYVAVDTDTDHNGDISEREVEEKFKTYIDVVFDILDNNTDGRVTQPEVESPRLSLAEVRRLIH